MNWSKVIRNNQEAEDAELKELIDSRVGFYDSADLAIGTHSILCEYNKFLNEEIFNQWMLILNELDIIHPMVLYSMANTGITVDVKCAFLIESFEGLAELIASKNSKYKIPEKRKGESHLGNCVKSIINLYGMDIFDKEMEKKEEGFISVLVNSRNRIAHIKSKNGKRVLNGTESILYSIKLSYLYRVVLFSLLGIGYSEYSNKLKESVSQWNDWENVLNNLLLEL